MPADSHRRVVSLLWNADSAAEAMRRLARILWAALFSVLVGCTVAKVVVEHEPEPKTPLPTPVEAKSKPAQLPPTASPVRKPEPVPAPSAPAARVEPKPQPQSTPSTQLRRAAVPPEALSDVALLVSDEISAYTLVSSELQKHLGRRAKIYNFKGDPAKGGQLIAQLQRSATEPQVVAIGLLAARAARALSGKQVIFCQVFDYADYGLIKPWMKGVSMLPNFGDGFRVWKELDPLLGRVALITGPNQGRLVADALAAARDQDIELVHRLVDTDKEMLYAFKNLAPEIQGLWLLPDNRVLSKGVIRSIMSHGVRQGKELMVFSPTLLGLGGLISLQGDEADVAAQVLTRLREAYGQAEVPGPDVVSLTKMRIQINAAMTKRLGLSIPTEYRRVAYEP